MGNETDRFLEQCQEISDDLGRVVRESFLILQVVVVQSRQVRDVERNLKRDEGK